MEYLIADQGDDMSEHGVTYRIPNTFLHGNVETDAGFDIDRYYEERSGGNIISLFVHWISCFGIQARIRHI